jgi:hypothetical protein
VNHIEKIITLKKAAQVLENGQSGNYFNCTELRNQQNLSVAELTEQAAGETYTSQ